MLKDNPLHDKRYSHDCLGDKVLRLVYYTNDESWKERTAQTVLSGLDNSRGRELGLVSHASAMARLGHDVSVFTPSVYQSYDYGVYWRNSETLLEMLDQEKEPIDALIGWSWPLILGGESVAKKCRLKLNFEMTMDFIVGEDTERYIDYHFCLSEFHRRALLKFDPTLDPEKVIVCTTIGYNKEEFKDIDHVEKFPGNFVWMSSPDRGLWNLLKLWPKILDKLPEARLDIFYGFNQMFESIKWGSNFRSERLWECKERLNQPGIFVHENSNREEVLSALSKCVVYFYPLDPISSAENLCLSVQEAMASNCVVVTSDADALGELYKDYTEQFPCQKIESALPYILDVCNFDGVRYKALDRQRKILDHIHIDSVTRHVSSVILDMIKEKYS